MFTGDALFLNLTEVFNELINGLKSHGWECHEPGFEGRFEKTEAMD